MKIGIVTFHWACNYGAVLQSYALLTYLRSRGFDVELVDYRPSWAKDVARPAMPRSLGGIVTLCDELYKRSVFKRFRKKHFVTSSKQTTTLSDLLKDAAYDVLIVGSDQVFNPDIIACSGNLDSVYLLDIPSFQGEKIAYAASFGNSTLAEQYAPCFKKHLADFRSIGVREKSGLKILHDLDLEEGVCVPDPTFLLNDYSKLHLPPKNSNDYILGVIFQHTENSNRCVDHLKNRWTEAEFLRIISLKERMRGGKGFVHPSPEEWIAAIRDARFVVTDSFHCTVFSILMHRPFVSLSLDAWGSDWCERIKFLLDSLGLSHRFLSSYDPDTLDKILNTDINWDMVDSKINILRERGENFLMNCLAL